MPDIRPASADLLQEISHFQAVTAETFGFSLTDTPGDIVAKIKDQIAQIEDDGTELDEDSLAGLAVVLGEQYVRQFGWHWAEVNFKDDGEDAHYVACVLIADDSLAIAPVWWISEILDGEKSNSILLNFNMVAANQVPLVEPGRALILH